MVTASAALPGMAQDIVVSADSQYAYVMTTYPATPTLKRVHLPDMTVDLTVPMPQLLFSETSMQVSPINAHTIALGYSYVDVMTGPFRTVQILDDGVARVNAFTVSNQSVGGDSVQWSADASKLFINDIDLDVASVNASGLAPATTLLSLTAGSGFIAGGIYTAGGILYSQGGAAFNPATSTIAGSYVFQNPTSNGPAPGAALLPDPSTGRTFASYVDSVFDSAFDAAVPTLESYDLTHFMPLWIARFPNGVGTPVRWGADGLAVVASQDNGEPELLLLNGTFVAP
jgi:hypothetical protein